MARALVGAIFGAIVISKLPSTWSSIGYAADERTLDAIALGTYDVLKLAVMVTFTVLVLIRPSPTRVARQPLAFASCAGAIAALVLLQSPDRDRVAANVLAGDVVTIAFCVWQLVAVITLGRCFGILPEARGLVTRGPYRLMRHPVYFGELGACGGLVLAHPSAWNLGCAAAFAGCQAIRMRLEEQALTREFAEYVTYAQRTPRLLPHLPSLNRGTAAPIGGSGTESALP